MAGHDRSPQHQPREDPGDTWERAHGPYLCFVAAFLRQAVTDARRTPKGTGSWTENTDGGTAGRQREAQEFLLDLNPYGQNIRTCLPTESYAPYYRPHFGLSSTPLSPILP